MQANTVHPWHIEIVEISFKVTAKRFKYVRCSRSNSAKVEKNGDTCKPQGINISNRPLLRIAFCLTQAIFASNQYTEANGNDNSYPTHHSA